MSNVFPRTYTNDLTFTMPSRQSRKDRSDHHGRAAIIRPGMLTATDSLESHYRRYLDQAIHKGKLVAPLVEEWMRPEMQSATVADSRAIAPQVKAARYAGLIAFADKAATKFSSYRRAIADGNWRAFFSGKHKHYVADQGVRLRAASFRLQSAALVFAAVIVLASANTFAPAGAPKEVATPVSQPTRLTSDATVVGATASSNGSQNTGMGMLMNGASTANGGTAVTNSGWRNAPVPAGQSSGTSSTGAAVTPSTNPTTPSNPSLTPTTPSTAPTSPGVTTPMPSTPMIPTTPSEPQLPSIPVVTEPDPVTPTPPPATDPSLLEGVVDGVTGALGGVVDGLL